MLKNIIFDMGGALPRCLLSNASVAGSKWSRLEGGSAVQCQPQFRGRLKAYARERVK